MIAVVILITCHKTTNRKLETYDPLIIYQIEHIKIGHIKIINATEFTREPKKGRLTRTISILKTPSQIKGKKL